MQVTVKENNKVIETIQMDRPMEIEEIVEVCQKKLEYPIYCARINGHRASLNEIVRESCEVDLLNLQDPWANMVYQASLSLLYRKAVHDVLGKDVEVKFNNSLSKGIFTTLKPCELQEHDDLRIEERMKELVQEKQPIQQKILGFEKLKDYYHQEKMSQMVFMVENTPDLKMAFESRLLDEKAIFYLYMVPHTGYLQYFNVRRYKNGMLLRFPHPTNPIETPVFQEQKLLYNAFSEATKWDRITEIHYAADLNHAVLEHEEKQLVLLSEALHEKRIAEIAEMIKQQEKRIILIAGPSSSGKTTFAKRLCIQLRVAGFKPLYLGTDDYFKERADTPLNQDGEKDFESLRAVDIDLFTTQINALLKGEKVDLPTFDFVKGEKVYGKRITSLKGNQPIVIEGLHCLNPELTKGLKDEDKFKIYISPLTQLNIDANNRVPTTDARMLRRIVRDAKFRNIKASETIERWRQVRKGEEEYIFPYCDSADVFFNSHTVYELALLKTYAKPQLEAIEESDEAYPEASRMLHFLQFFKEMDHDDYIPNNSIMREFIGGSILKDE